MTNGERSGELKKRGKSQKLILVEINDFMSQAAPQLSPIPDSFTVNQMSQYCHWH
jgi:hypothetical protein